MKKLLLIIFFCFIGFFAFAQTDTGKAPAIVDTQKPVLPVTIKKAKPRSVADSLRKVITRDSVKIHKKILRPDSITQALSEKVKATNTDTVKKNLQPVITKKRVDSIYLKLLDNPFTRTSAKPIYLIINERQRQSKDEYFYLLAGLLLFLAFIKLVFKKYFKNIFRLFFQPSFRQKQTREQLSQNNLPSLLLNLFFIFSASAYVSFLVRYYHLFHFDYWLLLLYIAAFLLILYTGKFIFLSFSGWVFEVREAANVYIFAVYLINKLLGVILIPFTILIAFSQPFIINVSITISALLIFLLFIYRYLVSYVPVRKEVRVSVLHFLLYIFSFEIIPLLLIYKTLIFYMNKSL